MKTLLFSLIATAVILTSTFAQSASNLIPSFKAHINNHTSLPTDSLIVRVDLDCFYKSGVVWPETKSCGSEVLEIPVQADGTFVVPAMKYQKKGSINNYRFSYSVKTKAMYPHSINYEFFSGKDIRSAPAKLAETSIYEMPALNVNVVTPTGENYATWRGIITHPSDTVKDPCVELIFLVKVAKEYQIDEIEMRDSESDTLVPGKIPMQYFGTSGNPGANLPVEGSLYYRTSKPQCLVNQSQVMFDKMVTAKGSLKDLYKIFNNSTYKID